MKRTADYSNTTKFSNKKSFNGKPVEAGKVLVPFRKETFNLPADSYIQDNFTTVHLGGFDYEIGFMPIFEECFASYMGEFWDEINDDLKIRRKGTSQPSVKNQILNANNPDHTDNELKIRMLAYFDKKNPLYAQIIRLSMSGMGIDDICTAIGLKPNRGRQEINNAHDAVCDYLKLRHHKKNRK